MSNVLDEFEGPLDLPAEGLNVPIAMRDPRYLHLSPNDKVVLVNFYRSPAYPVLMKLMQGEVEKEETTHFRAYRDPDKFLSSGYVAVAMGLFLERIQQEIARQVDEFAGEVEFVKVKQKQLETSIEEQVVNEFK